MTLIAGITAVVAGLAAITAFLIQYGKDIVLLKNLLTNTMGSLSQLLSFLPGACMAIVTVLLVVGVLYKFLGREG